MAHTVPAAPVPRRAQGRWGVVLFTALAVAGLYAVKWSPLAHKALFAAAHHAIGTSILTGTAARAPAPSWGAAWHYTVTYVGDVWQAMVVGLLLGAGVQALLPADWLRRVLGHLGLGSVLWAGLAALPSMM